MIFIDIQGFQYGTNNFLCKEIAVTNLDSGYYSHRFVRMPIDISHYCGNIRAHMNYVTKNIHGIEWVNEDDLDYENITDYLNNAIGMSNKIYVKGHEKKEWLERLLVAVNVIDLEQEDCPSFEELKSFLKSHHCQLHLNNNNLNCALENVNFLAYWYKYCRKNE